MCGPTAAEEQIQGQSASFSSLLNANYAQNFGAHSAILKNLSDVLTPIVQAGPNQRGMSPEQRAAITGNAINTSAANYKNVATVVGTDRAAAGGGNDYVPSGADKQVQAEIASRSAEGLSNTENQIEQADWDLGRSKFNSAVSGLGGVAAGYDPNGTAREAEGASSNAFGQAQANQEAGDAWMQSVGGFVGGLGGAALGNPKLFGGKGK